MEREKQLDAETEVFCSQFEVVGPVEEVDSVTVFIDPVVTVRGPVAALLGVQVIEVLSIGLQGCTVNISAVEVICSAFELENSLVHSEDEVQCSVASVMHIGPGGYEVIATVVESTGPVVKVCPAAITPVLEETDTMLEIPNSTSTSLWLRVSGLTTGVTGDVGSGLVPGLKGYGVSNGLPIETERQHFYYVY